MTEEKIKPTTHREELDRAWLSGNAYGFERAIDSLAKEIGLPPEDIVTNPELRSAYVKSLKEWEAKARLRFMGDKPDDSYYYTPSEYYVNQDDDDKVANVPSKKLKLGRGVWTVLQFVAMTFLFVAAIELSLFLWEKL